MSDVFLTSVNAVFPIILLILLGYFLKRTGLLNKGFIKTGNTLVFKVCLPCMLFVNIYDNMNSFSDIRWDVIIYAVVAILIIFALGLLTAVLTTAKCSRRGVILQCTFRSNFAIIGLALVERLGGDAGIAGMISAFSIPLFNVLAVIALSVFADKEESQTVEIKTKNRTDNIADGSGAETDGNGNVLCVPYDNDTGADKKSASKRGLKYVLLNIIKNPLIIGVLSGLVCVGIRELERTCLGGVVFRLDTQLKLLYTVLCDLKAIASPLALLVLGGQFEFSAVKGMTKEIIVGTVWRVILAPLMGIGAAVIIGSYTNLFTFGADVYPSLIALFGTPVAVSSAIMAGEMKNDAQLATQLVVWTSICSVITIFVTVFLLMACGLLTAV